MAYSVYSVTCYLTQSNKDNSSPKRTRNLPTAERMAVVRWSQKISLRRRPLPGGAGRPRFNQLEIVTTFTNRPSLAKIDARNFELSWYNRPTSTNKPTDRTDYTAPLSLARSVIRRRIKKANKHVINPSKGVECLSGIERCSPHILQWHDEGYFVGVSALPI